jgi:cytochrome c oxidase cbb3-type subunit III
MSRNRRQDRRIVLAALALAGLTVAGAGVASAQAETKTNPLAGDARAIDGGKNIYRGRCGVCHGVDARGYRGPDLTTGDWVHGGSDAQLFTTIFRGVAGTEMPPSPNMSDEEVWMVIAYLRTLGAPGGAAPERGDAVRGEQMFWAKDKGNCGQCHMIGARGGRLGPNLSRIGASRSATVLTREIRTPHEVIPVGFETITAVTRDGRKIRGVRKNEDTFTVQLMTGSEELLSFFKRELADLVAEPERSLMPAYGPERLPDADLTDLVRYLRTLRGSAAAQQ